MSIDRSATPPFLEAHQPAGAAESDGHAVPAAIRLQILATEHWSLLATRSLAWNEVFARAGMYLSLVSGSIVALALVGDGSRFGDAVLVFGIVILPVVLFVGVTTFLRLGVANYLDARCVIGMNRIRAGYLEMAPGMDRFFVSGVTDDPAGIERTMAVLPGSSPIIHLLAATPSLVSVVNSVIAGAIGGFVVLLARGAEPVAVVSAAVIFLLAFLAHALYGRRRMAELRRAHDVRHPGDRSTSAHAGPGAV